MIYTEGYFDYPMWIASKRAGSYGQAKAYVQTRDIDCINKKFYIKGISYYAGAIDQLIQVASFVENDRIFNYNMIFEDVKETFGKYGIGVGSAKSDVEFMESTCR